MRWLPTLFCIVLITLAPLALWRTGLEFYFLRLDDFDYLSWSRLASQLRAHATQPHNGHLTPVFLLQTHILARLAGSLEVLPLVLGCAAFATLSATGLMAGWLVARDTGRLDWGLAAAACFNLSTVPGPALLWYSASQALTTAFCIVAMLAALSAWRTSQYLAWLLLSLILALLAPFCWSAGYTAGITGALYVVHGFSNRLRTRLSAATLLLLATGSAVAIAMRTAGDEILKAASRSGHGGPELESHWIIPQHVNQAVWEKLILNNLGLDAHTTSSQSLLLSIAAILLYLSAPRRPGAGGSWTRGWIKALPLASFRSSPVRGLFAAGLTIILANYILIFATRGRGYAYLDLRALGWYDAIPQLGALLCAAGLWAQAQGPANAQPAPTKLTPLGPRSAVALLSLSAILFLLESPRADRILFEYDTMATLAGDLAQPHARSAPADWAARAHSQRRALHRLGELEQKLKGHTLTAQQAQVLKTQYPIPGAPEDSPGYRLLDLILPPSAIETSPH